MSVPRPPDTLSVKSETFQVAVEFRRTGGLYFAEIFFSFLQKEASHSKKKKKITADVQKNNNTLPQQQQQTKKNK